METKTFIQQLDMLITEYNTSSGLIVTDINISHSIDARYPNGDYWLSNTISITVKNAFTDSYTIKNNQK